MIWTKSFVRYAFQKKKVSYYYHVVMVALVINVLRSLKLGKDPIKVKKKILLIYYAFSPLCRAPIKEIKAQHTPFDFVAGKNSLQPKFQL